MVSATSNSIVSPASILLVDDDPLFRSATKRVLALAGHAVVESATAEEALAQVEATAFDLVLTDVNMPGMTGLDLLRRVRQRDALVSIVLITGDPSAKAAASAASLGAMHYLIKPVDAPQMLSITGRAIRLTRLARLQRLGGRVAGGATIDDVPTRLGREAQLVHALRSLWLAHQPIVRAEDNQILGYEVLMRFDDPSLKGPPALLELAEECGRLETVGRVVRHRAARSPALQLDGTLLFVNLHAHDLMDESLRSPMAPLSQVASQVVLELTERASLERIPDVGEIIRDLRSLGFRIGSMTSVQATQGSAA
jgi:CheY-like chemotaxis protein